MKKFKNNLLSTSSRSSLENYLLKKDNDLQTKFPFLTALFLLFLPIKKIWFVPSRYFVSRKKLTLLLRIFWHASIKRIWFTSKIVERVTITINGWNFPLWTDDEYFFKYLLVITMLFIFIEQILGSAWPSLFRITLTLLMSVSLGAQIFFSLSREYIAKAVSDSRYVR